MRRHAGRIVVGLKLAGPMGPANSGALLGGGVCKNRAMGGWIKTMRQSGADRGEKNKEAALGSLAVSVPNFWTRRVDCVLTSIGHSSDHNLSLRP